jgi:glycine dehydrogenase
MIAIRAEIKEIEDGVVSHEDSPLAGAPHTLEVVTGAWERAYSREQAAFPAGYNPDKYWPPVARIDQAYGDRHLVCSCPDPSAFAEPADADA